MESQIKPTDAVSCLCSFDVVTPCFVCVQGVKYSIEASSSINSQAD